MNSALYSLDIVSAYLFLPRFSTLKLFEWTLAPPFFSLLFLFLFASPFFSSFLLCLIFLFSSPSFLFSFLTPHDIDNLKLLGRYHGNRRQNVLIHFLFPSMCAHLNVFSTYLPVGCIKLLLIFRFALTRLPLSCFISTFVLNAVFYLMLTEKNSECPNPYPYLYFSFNFWPICTVALFFTYLIRISIWFSLLRTPLLL